MHLCPCPEKSGHVISGQKKMQLPFVQRCPLQTEGTRFPLLGKHPSRHWESALPATGKAPFPLLGKHLSQSTSIVTRNS